MIASSDERCLRLFHPEVFAQSVDLHNGLMAGFAQDGEIALAQFNRLIEELLSGTVRRSCFHPWEIDLFLDIESSNLRLSARRELLRRYQKAVCRHFENESGPPPRFSEFLQARRARKTRDGDAAPVVAEDGSQRPA